MEEDIKLDFVEREEVGEQIQVDYGGAPPGLDLRLLPFDPMQAAREPVLFGASSNRKMQVAEAAKMFSSLMERVEVHVKTEGVQMAYLNALLLAHAKNSASVLVPDRAVFFIGRGARRVEYNFYTDAMQILGDSSRRFFRAYADYERALLVKLLGQRASKDPDTLADIADIDWVAHDRGLSRAPHLCFDSSDACTRLTAFERNLLTHATASILSKTANSVDRQALIRAAPAASVAQGGSGYDNVNSGSVGTGTGGPGY